ncbi:MAG: hypothetical protein ACXVZ1_04510 [Gaiellaceae bacterium]
MASRAQVHRRQRARARRRMHEPVRAARRTRRVAFGVLIGTVTLLVLMVTAFANQDQPASQTLTAQAGTRLLATGRPAPLVVARIGQLQILLPVARSAITAIGYHALQGMLPLDPEGSRVNEGLLARLLRHFTGGGGGGIRYYQLSGGEGSATSALDVGAAPGVDVYAPVSGTVTGISAFIVNGRPHGALLDIRPTAAPSLMLEMSGLQPDPSVAVGTTLVAGASRVGSIVDLARVEKQALARYTQDRGDHVTIAFAQGTSPVLP